MKINKTNYSLKIWTLITYLIMVATNALANILPINGVTSGEVSDSYPNLFAPAGITFSIWGVIYLLLFLYSIYGFGIFQRESDPYKEELFKKIGIYFSISSILNTMWIFAWHYRFIEVSLAIIISILLLLIIINNITKRAELSLKDYFFIRFPFSIYMGWLTVATIANVTTLLVKLGFDGFGLSESFWTIGVIVVGLIIASLTILKNNDVAYGLPIIWAYIGIYIKHISRDGWNAEYSTIIFTTVASIVILVMVEVYTLFNLRKKDKKIKEKRIKDL
ncbi:hypothetical protein [Tissierella creatinophila]|uniref:Lantibiotic ABC transporter permease n=1 Tax=Tissierella creatinophila DSM 6911 TaxID=1123403 RepID=A0A1U7M4S3_TISCR|nr:hypothetical protein [Tissierella creatinophila]OLS02313.1 hypothetical protein TICRE_16990 [Tissierella creatinophila DSM 6911]